MIVLKISRILLIGASCIISLHAMEQPKKVETLNPHAQDESILPRDLDETEWPPLSHEVSKKERTRCKRPMKKNWQFSIPPFSITPWLFESADTCPVGYSPTSSISSHKKASPLSLNHTIASVSGAVHLYVNTQPPPSSQSALPAPSPIFGSHRSQSTSQISTLLTVPRYLPTQPQPMSTPTPSTTHP
jgi:hypothetical protein